MLVGIFKPYIVIPDIEFDEIQLRNILLYELSHLKRFDIAIKWLTMIATSVHWFNPVMYFIKKEINRACELSCDENVIKNLNNAQKQEYGNALISVVAESKHPVGILQATMCEEKKSMKERLIAIMMHNRKSRFITGLSAGILILVIAGAIALGSTVGKLSPPYLYIGAENATTIVAITGGFEWKNGGNAVIADSAIEPKNFKYKSYNIIDVASRQQLIIGTQKIKIDKKYNFTIDNMTIYKNGKSIRFDPPDPSFTNGNLYLQAPSDAGEYVYSLRLNFKGKGTVSYGFVVRVDMMTYNLEEISKYRTPYIGDFSKVSGIVKNLPIPYICFNQKYFSLETDKKPYKLNVYYEAKSDALNDSEWPDSGPKSEFYSNMQKNVLVLFCMITNLDEVTFPYRNSKSIGELDTSKYNYIY